MGRLQSSVIKGLFAAMVGTGTLAAEPDFHYAYGRPQSSEWDKNLSQQKFIFSARELGKGDFITEGAVLDEAIGILCEWRERVYLHKTQSGTVTSADMREFDARCMSAEKTPPVWTATGRKEDSFLSGVGEYGLHQSKKRPGLLMEWSNSVELDTFIKTSTMRSVDLDKNEVCLDMTKSHLIGLTRYKTYARQHLGCFPLEGKAGMHADKLMKQLNIRTL